MVCQLKTVSLLDFLKPIMQFIYCSLVNLFQFKTMNINILAVIMNKNLLPIKQYIRFILISTFKNMLEN